MIGQTLFFDKRVKIIQTSAIVGPKEKDGPLGKYFDNYIKDDLMGQKSYEKAEILMHKSALKNLLNSAKLTAADINCFFCGDLLDEIFGSNFTMREFDSCYFGLYNACATYGEGLILAASMLYGGLMNRAVVSTSSHFSTAERQYRYPLELGSQRTPLAQWTVTGAGGIILSSEGEGNVYVTCATIGKVIDYGIEDANDLGIAMLPACKETLKAHFRDTGRSPSYYDLILTGDLGDIGNRLLKKLLKNEGIDIENNCTDGGVLIYNREGQDVGQGGSGAACSNVVFNAYVYKKMLAGEFSKVLLVPTGALLSKISPLQGETIPCIAHAVSIEVV